MKKYFCLFFVLIIISSYASAETTLEEALLKSKSGSLEFSQIVIDRDIQNKALFQSLSSILPYINYTLSADSSDMSQWSYGQSI